jgi:hypothetical protein
MHYQEHYLWASPPLSLHACLNWLHRYLTRIVNENVGQESPTLTFNLPYHPNLAKGIFRSICMFAASVYQ